MAGTISDAWMNTFFLSMETGQYEQSKFILLLTQRYEDLLRHCHDLKKYTRWGEGGWDTWAGQFCKWCEWCQERRVGFITSLVRDRVTGLWGSQTYLHQLSGNAGTPTLPIRPIAQVRKTGSERFHSQPGARVKPDSWLSDPRACVLCIRCTEAR